MANETTTPHFTAKLLAGRSGEDNAQGFSSLTRSYQIVRAADDPPTSANAAADEADIFMAAGLPQIGDPHSAAFPNLVCVSRKFEEQPGVEKSKIIVECEYSASAPESNVPRGQSVEKLSWSHGTESRDAICDVVTKAVITTSAGEPFESVPQISVPMATWTKVLKTKTRHIGWLDYAQKINAAQATCGGVTCAAKTLKCEGVDEDRIWADADGWQYRYTITITRCTNKVKVADATTLTEIGWDVGVIDAGMYQKGSDNKLELLKVRGVEDRIDHTVTSPVLLDGQGHVKDVYNLATDPYVLRFQVYESTTFPAIFLNDSGES